MYSTLYVSVLSLWITESLISFYGLMTFQPSSHSNLCINSSSQKPEQKQSINITRQTKGIKIFHYCCFHDPHSSRIIYLIVYTAMYCMVLGGRGSSKVGGVVCARDRFVIQNKQQMSAIHQLPHNKVPDRTKKPFLLMNRNSFANNIGKYSTHVHVGTHKLSIPDMYSMRNPLTVPFTQY